MCVCEEGRVSLPKICSVVMVEATCKIYMKHRQLNYANEVTKINFGGGALRVEGKV